MPCKYEMDGMNEKNFEGVNSYSKLKILTKKLYIKIITSSIYAQLIVDCKSLFRVIIEEL